MRCEASGSFILLVDDDPLVRDAYSFVIERALSLPVVAAADAYEALALLRGEWSPDGRTRRPLPVAAVVVDIDMPGMDGFELLRELASLLPPEVPRGLCSGRRSLDAPAGLGVSFAVRKSASTAELVEALRRALHLEDRGRTGRVERPRGGVGRPTLDARGFQF
jgi:CheY-like chemotaxis protein